jgi:hypothetical protein
MPDYEETDMSREAREVVKDEVKAKRLDEKVAELKLDSGRRKFVTNPDGSLNTKKAVQLLGEYPLSNLIVDCMRMNYTRAEVHEIIKEIFRGKVSKEKDPLWKVAYSEGKNYAEWCAIFEIKT